MSGEGSRAALHALLVIAGSEAAQSADLERARVAWAAWQAARGVWLYDDHDPLVAPGVHTARNGDVPAPSQLRRLARSWEAFDRAFEACSPEVERRVFDTRVWPFVVESGLAACAREVAADHLFVVDSRVVASFPAERWDLHAARCSRGLAAQAGGPPVDEALLRGLRRLTG